MTGRGGVLLLRGVPRRRIVRQLQQLDRVRRGRFAGGGDGWSDADRRRSGRKPSKAGGGADSGVGGTKTERRFRRWSAGVVGWGAGDGGASGTEMSGAEFIPRTAKSRRARSLSRL